MADTKLRCEPFVDDDGRAQSSDTTTNTEKVRVPGPWKRRRRISRATEPRTLRAECC